MADRGYRDRERGSYGRSDSIFDDRERPSEERGFFERAGDEARSWLGGDQDRDHGNYHGQPDVRETNRPYGSGRRSHFDDHYRGWREQQIRQFDRDYDEYRQERQARFESDFDSWRRNRQSQSGTTTGLSGTGSSRPSAAGGSANPSTGGSRATRRTAKAQDSK